MWRDFYAKFLGRFSGTRALGQAAEQNRLERFFTFPNFEASANRCGQELQDGGLSQVEIESFPADGKTSWYGWNSMKAWDATEARLWMSTPDQTLLCDWSEVPESLVMYSGPCDVEGELVQWNGEEGVELAGKIPFTRHRINDVFPQMRAKGVSATQLYFLAACDGHAARWLAEVVTGTNYQQWHRAQLRLLSGSWPFDESRTRRWFIEQADLSVASVERFGLPAAEVRTRQEDLRFAVGAWC